MFQSEATEKRKFERVSARLPVKYRKLNEPWGVMKTGTLTRNLSSGGVNFRSGEFMPKSGRIVMELDVPGRKPLKMISRVAWILKTKHGDDYNVGSQFLEMSRKDREDLSSYLKELVSQPA